MEKIYRVKLNSNGMPNFSTAVEIADRPQGEWIPCEERMPMESSFEPLLICDSNGHMTVGAMILGKWAKQANIGAVVAWMPIEPWKGADDVLEGDR